MTQLGRKSAIASGSNWRWQNPQHLGGDGPFCEGTLACRDELRDFFRSLFQLPSLGQTLPHDPDSPVIPQQRFCRRLVASRVAIELGLPELRPRGGGGGIPAAFMAVPEAPMDEQYGAVLGEYYVWPSGQVLGVEPVAQPLPVERPSQFQFRFRVRSADGAHHARSDLGRNDVCHLC